MVYIFKSKTMSLFIWIDFHKAICSEGHRILLTASVFHILSKANLNNPKKLNKSVFIIALAALSCFTQIGKKLKQISPVTSGSRLQYHLHYSN